MEADLKAGHCVDPDREMQEPDILSPSRRELCRAQSVERRYQRTVDQEMFIFFFLVSVWVGAGELVNWAGSVLRINASGKNRRKSRRKKKKKKAERRQKVKEWLALFRANKINISIREKANGGAKREKGRREKSPTKKEKREREREREKDGRKKKRSRDGE